MDIALSPFRDLAISDEERALYYLDDSDLARSNQDMGHPNDGDRTVRNTENTENTNRNNLRPLEETALRNAEDTALGDEKRKFGYQSQNHPPSGHKRSRRTRKSIDSDLDFEIYEDPDAPKGEGLNRSFYGSSVPVLLEKKRGEDVAKYQGIHDLCRVVENDKTMLEGFGIWDDDDPEMAPYLQHGIRTFLERVTGYYEWTYLEAPNDVWLWVLDKGYNHRWASEQTLGFRELLHKINGMVKMVFKAKMLHGIYANDPVCPFLNNRLQQLGITNLRVRNDMPYVYHFYPCGEDLPRYRRADFTEMEAYRIDWQGLGKHWLDGEARGTCGEDNMEFAAQVKAAAEAELENFYELCKIKAELIEKEDDSDIDQGE